MFLRRSLVIHPQRAVKTALANAEHRLTADARSSGEAVTTQPQREGSRNSPCNASHHSGQRNRLKPWRCLSPCAMTSLVAVSSSSATCL